MDSSAIVIANGARALIGGFRGALAETPASRSAAARSVSERLGIPAGVLAAFLRQAV
jgi:hypothetical protein